MNKILMSIEGDQGQHLAEFTAPTAEIAYEKLLKFEKHQEKELLEEQRDISF